MLQRGSDTEAPLPRRRSKAPIASTKARRPTKQRHRHKSRAQEEEEYKQYSDHRVKLFNSPKPKAIAPYSPASEGEEATLRFLIHYFTKERVTNVGPRFEWYPLAVRDDAFFHALISSTSSHAAYMQKRELPRNFYFHRGKAIELVNKRLAEGAHDEGTINTIIVFALQESYEGRPTTAMMHCKGVINLVRAAGGINSLALDAKTRRHVYLMDLSACISLESKPILSSGLNPDLNIYFGFKSQTTEEYTKTFEARLFNFTSSSLSSIAADVLWGLRNISTILEAIHLGIDSPDTVLPDDIQFSDRVEALQRIANTLWYVEDPKDAQHAIFKTFGWACMIYIYTTLRELPPELGVNSLLAGKTRNALESCSDLNVLLATFHDLLLWILFVCGKVADERDQTFFVKQASKILLMRKVENSEGIIIQQGGFLWPERLP